MGMNITVVENRFAIAEVKQGVSVYDFDFELHFNCSHPYRIDDTLPVFMRMGAIHDYSQTCDELKQIGLMPVNNPDEHLRASELVEWYPLIESSTPRSAWFDSPPDVEEVAAQFDWPVFIKGSRQTAMHDPSLAIARGPDDYERIRAAYQDNAVLGWQSMVIREFVDLAPVKGSVINKIRPSVEYRTFWLHGTCVGVGQYWYQIAQYNVPDLDLGVELAQRAASILNVPFLVIDVGKTIKGEWIIIECNDAQESGYSAIEPHTLWSNVLKSWS